MGTFLISSEIELQQMRFGDMRNVLIADPMRAVS
jgi:hypothetical protein